MALHFKTFAQILTIVVNQPLNLKFTNEENTFTFLPGGSAFCVC